jgi:hypothetical protein
MPYRGHTIKGVEDAMCVNGFCRGLGSGVMLVSRLDSHLDLTDHSSIVWACE